MSVKIFQNLIQQIREIVDVEFGIMDDAGIVLASSNEKKVGQVDPAAGKILNFMDQAAVFEGISYEKVFIKNKVEYITYLKSTAPGSTKILSLITINVVNVKNLLDEKIDKTSFIKNILIENILPGDIALRSKELHLPYNAYRVVFLIKTEINREMHVHEIIQGLFPGKTRDFVIILDEENTVLLKELRNCEDEKEIEKTAKAIVDMLGTELMIKAYVGIGTVVDTIRDVARSYKEAQMALLVGRIFENDKAIINYNSLGIGRLIYQLPVTLCKLFLQEVFKDGTFDSLDAETLLTIQKFFENNLNVSETSRQLYVHRNTLVYRLDKIQKITGLDLTNFDDAVTFKVAMLVKKYLDKGEKV